MRKWMNTVFFGGCFMVAMLLEAYGMIIWEGNLFSAIALGLVVLITGYLFMDSIRSRLMQSSENAKFYMDRVLNEESEKWSDRHTEMVNLQKASYTATKKSTALLVEQFNEVLTRLETLEDNNARMLQKVIELQKASLEGQKNALNLELSYLKDHTRRIVGAMKEENNEDSINQNLSGILSAIEENNRLLREQLETGRTVEKHYDTYRYEKEDNEEQITYAEDQFGKAEDKHEYVEDEFDKAEDQPISFEDEFEKVEDQSFDDPFAAFNDELGSLMEQIQIPISTNGFVEDTAFEEEAAIEEGSTEEQFYTEDFYNDLDTTDHIDDELLTENGEFLEEKTPAADLFLENETKAEVINPVDTIDEPVKITPLYDDPNKALTADEIAALFASFGQ